MAPKHPIKEKSTSSPEKHKQGAEETHIDFSKLNFSKLDFHKDPVQFNQLLKGLIEVIVTHKGQITVPTESNTNNMEYTKTLIENTDKLIKQLEVQKGTITALNNRIKQLESDIKRKDENTAANTSTEVLVTPAQNSDKLELKIKNEIQNEIRAEIDEKFNQIKRDKNLILMNIPETQQGSQTITKILKILLPNKKLEVSNQRIGIIKTNSSKPRPVRIILPTSYDRYLAIQNCKQLRNLEEFRSISVCKDLTKAEQMTERKNYEDRKRLKRLDNK